MKIADSKARQDQAKRKQRLSPDVVEFLRMLNALEVELENKATPAH